MEKTLPETRPRPAHSPDRLPPREHAEAVQGMFDRIAGVYDLLNHTLSFGTDIHWRRVAVRDFVHPGMNRIVDACGGTGDLTLAVEKVQPGTFVLCTDFSREMLRIADRKLDRPHLVCAAGDALRLPVPDGSVDGVMCAFGIRNVSDWRAGIAEFARVLRPGGRVLILEFMVSRDDLITRLFKFYFRRIVPVIGRAISRDRSAYSYLPASVDSFCTPEEMIECMQAQGLNLLKRRYYRLGATTQLVAEKIS